MSFDSDFASTYNQIKARALVNTSSVIDEGPRYASNCSHRFLYHQTNSINILIN